MDDVQSSNSTLKKAPDNATFLFPKVGSTPKGATPVRGGLLNKWASSKSINNTDNKAPKPATVNSSTLGTQSPIQKVSFELTSPRQETPKSKASHLQSIIPPPPKPSSMSIDQLSEAILPSKPVPEKDKRLTLWSILNALGR